MFSPYPDDPYSKFLSSSMDSTPFSNDLHLNLAPSQYPYYPNPQFLSSSSNCKSLSNDLWLSSEFSPYPYSQFFSCSPFEEKEEQGDGRETDQVLPIRPAFWPEPDCKPNQEKDFGRDHFPHTGQPPLP